MEEKKECPICLGHDCSSEFQEYSNQDGIINFTCNVCGKYQIYFTAENIFRSSLEPKQRIVLSSIIRNRSERGEQLLISRENKQDLLDSMSIPSDPSEVMDLLLEYIALKTNNIPGKEIGIKSGTDYPIFFTKDPQSIKYYIENAIAENFFNTVPPQYESEDYVEYADIMLTSKGWKRIAELKKTKVKSNQAFVAMWFHPCLDQAWKKGFEKALNDTGFDPIKINNVEHNNKICDEIIANIRKSGLVVADFTGRRGGVYFEAGYAMGLGIPVIWTCREKELKRLHFDTRQYNHIGWNNPEDLREKLIHRIEATIPKK